MKTEARVVQYARKACATGHAFNILEGLSDLDIAREIGVHRSNVHCWRTRRTGISTISALKLGRLLLALDDQAPDDLRDAQAATLARA